jgi:S1-C subfamily serine protease
MRKVFEQDLLNLKHLDQLFTGLDVEEAGKGLIVSEVVAAGPADNAKLRRGDRILKVGDNEIRSKEDFVRALSTYGPGQRVPLRVLSKDEETWKRLFVWDRAQASLFQLTGVVAGDLDRVEDRRLFNSIYAEIYGRDPWGRLAPALVSAVQQDGPGSELGLKPGDVIVGIYDPDGRLQVLDNGTEELSVWLSQLRSLKRVQLSIYRSGAGFLKGPVALR